MATGEGRIRKDRILYLLTILIVTAVVIFLYLNWTSYTGLATRIITATVIAFFFTTGYTISNACRSATVVFGMELLSPFGVVVMFDTLSWFLVILPDIEVITEITQRIATPETICTFQNNNTLTGTQILLGSLHYAPLLAFSLIFLFCLCCVLFFEEATPINPTGYQPHFSGMLPPPTTAAGEPTEHKKAKFVRLLRGIADLLNHAQFAIFVVAVTLTKWRNFTVETVNKLLEGCQTTDLYYPLNGTLFTSYLIGSAICVLVLIFAPKSKNRRNTLIRKLKLKTRQERQPSLYFLRAKSNSGARDEANNDGY